MYVVFKVLLEQIDMMVAPPAHQAQAAYHLLPTPSLSVQKVQEARSRLLSLALQEVYSLSELSHLAPVTPPPFHSFS